MNKKAFSPLIAILSVLGVLITIYIILLLPIQKFTNARQVINFYSIIILWFIIQIAFILSLTKIGLYSKVWFGKYKKFIKNLSYKIYDTYLGYNG